MTYPSPAEQCMALIDEIRAEECDSVTINCQNPEGSGPDNEAVEYDGFHSDFEPRRFAGSTLVEALTACAEWVRIKRTEWPPQ